MLLVPNGNPVQIKLDKLKSHDSPLSFAFIYIGYPQALFLLLSLLSSTHLRSTMGNTNTIPAFAQNSLRIPVNYTAGAGINTNKFWCLDPSIDTILSDPAIRMCGSAWSDKGKEYAALAIVAAPRDLYNPVSNPNITIFKAKEARTTLPIQLNSTTPYVISQMVNTGNIFDSKAGKATGKTTGIVLMDKANPVGIFYSETCNNYDKDDNKEKVQTSDTEIFQTSPTMMPTFSTFSPTFSPTTVEPDVCGQFMYADYIAYYFDGHGRVTIGVPGTVGATEFVEEFF